MHLNPAAPVLALPGTGVQVGWDDPVVLTSASDAEARFLRSLEGGRRIGAAEQRRYVDLLARLQQHGLVEDDDPEDPARCVRIQGAGAVGTETAIALARSGVPVTVVDRAPARAGAAAHLPDPDCGAVALARVHDAVPTAELRGAHADAALDILISAGPAVARAQELLAADRPHLLVECGERGVRIGPLVVPGVTCCATCVGLAATQERSEWPVLALQGDSRRPRVRPVLATMAGAMAAHEALAFLANRPGTMWWVGDDGVSVLPAAAVHPDCRCTGAPARAAAQAEAMWGA